MKLFGYELTLRKKALHPVDTRSRWWPTIQESYAGAWQQNVEVRLEDALQYWAVFKCINLISSDIAKIGLRLLQQEGQIWVETSSPAFSPVLDKPNGFQNRIQFFRNWVESKLTRGNTYVLKRRDARQVVTGLFILDPNRVSPLVSDSGLVFYQLNKDNLSELDENSVVVPASEVIHDRFNTLYHPLVGMSPLYAAGLNAITGLRIQQNSTLFFGNGSRPGGVLTAPGAISDETALRLKELWETKFSGENQGKVAVLGDGLKYEQMTMSATDAQLMEQAKMTAEQVAGSFGVPAYMLNLGTPPISNNVEAMAQLYYTQTLQVLIEDIELCLDEGLGLRPKYRSEFDLNDLLRMDRASLVTAEAELVKAGIGAPNESRQRLNMKPVPGGDSPYMQQQQFSLEALAKRDEEDPFSKPEAAPTAAAPDEGDNSNDDSGTPQERAAQIAQVGLALRNRAKTFVRISS